MIGLFKKVIVDFPIKMKGNSKRTSGYSLSPLRVQNKDIGTVPQMCWPGLNYDCDTR